MNLDGEKTTYWTTATTVRGALNQLGLRFFGADTRAPARADIDREGMALRIATPKKLTLKIAGAKQQKRNVSAITVRGVLGKLHVGHDKNDKVTPSLDSFVKDGDKVVFTKVTKRKVHVGHEKLGFDTVTRADDSMTKGETSTVREGRSGFRDVTYRVVTHNGEVARKVLKAKVLRAPVSASCTSAPSPSPPAEPPAAPSAAAPPGTGSPRASPVATGLRTPATATTAGCSSASAPGRRTAAPEGRTRTAASSRSPWPSGSALPRVATARGPCAALGPDDRRSSLSRLRSPVW